MSAVPSQCKLSLAKLGAQSDTWDARGGVGSSCRRVLQHALSNGAEEGGDLARHLGDLLVLHEVLVGEVAGKEADGQVNGEERIGHGLTPQLPGNDLLVEHLADGPMENEHRERQGSEAGHCLSTEKLRDGARVGSEAVAMDGGQEFRPKWDEEDTTNDSIIEVEASQSQEQRGIGSSEVHHGIDMGSASVLWGVEHHLTASCDAHDHLDECPERMESSQVPQQGVHLGLVQRIAVESSSLRVRHLLEQGNCCEASEQLLDTLPRHGGDAR
mmetsp:Transcript_35952/g.54201  ORF Transcript_35952/g.54201 Transcript_35952/m.54201 type:complete len:271 (+) Transcript_35952:328-1140(+)